MIDFDAYNVSGIPKKCIYPGCRRVFKVLLRHGNTEYFYPLCKEHYFQYIMFDSLTIERRYREWKRKQKNNENGREK